MYLFYYYYLNFFRNLNEKDFYLFLKRDLYFSFILFKLDFVDFKFIYVCLYKFLGKNSFINFNFIYYFLNNKTLLKRKCLFDRRYLRRAKNEVKFFLIEDFKFRVNIESFLLLRSYVIDIRFYYYIQFLRLIVNSSVIRKVFLKYITLLNRGIDCLKVFFQRKILLIDSLSIIKIRNFEIPHKIIFWKIFLPKSISCSLLNNFHYNSFVRFILYMYKQSMKSLKTVKYSFFHRLRFEGLIDIYLNIEKISEKEIRFVLFKSNYNFLLKLVNSVFIKYFSINVFNEPFKSYDLNIQLESAFIKFFRNISWKFIFKMFEYKKRPNFFKVFIIQFIKRCKFFFFRLLINKKNLHLFITGLTYEFLLLNWHLMNFKKDLIFFSPIYFFIVFDRIDVDLIIKKYKFTFYLNIFNSNFDLIFLKKFLSHNLLLFRDLFLFLLKNSFKYKLLFFFFIINDNNILYTCLNSIIKYNNDSIINSFSIYRIYNSALDYKYIIFPNEL